MDPQLLRRWGHRRERKTPNVRCVAAFFSLALTASMFAEMQRKLRLNIYPQTLVCISLQTYVALELF